MGRADYYAPGDHNAICFECGKKHKASQMKKHWQGYYVCPRCWEPRQPQDFVRAVADVQTPAWVQPVPADRFAWESTAGLITTSTTLTPTTTEADVGGEDGGTITITLPSAPSPLQTIVINNVGEGSVVVNGGTIVKNAADNSTVTLRRATIVLRRGGTDWEVVGENGYSITYYFTPVWSLLTLPAGLREIVWNGSKFCAVGLASIGVTSPDGVSWTTQSLGVSIDWTGLAWNSSMFCALGNDGSATGWSAVSTDGVSWIQYQMSVGVNADIIAWNGSIFVGIDTGGVGNALTSADGINWTDTGTLVSGTSLVAGGSRFVLVGNDGVAQYSDNGSAWTAGTGLLGNPMRAVAWNGSVFSVIDTSGITYTSPTGAVWTQRETLASTGNWKSLTWTGVQFIAVKQGSTAYAASLDGITWTNGDMPVSSTWVGIAGNTTINVAITTGTTGAYIYN